MTKLATKIGILVLAAVAIAWDVFVAVEPTAGDTISELTLAASMVFPALPFGIGVLCGHLFWPNSYHMGWWAVLAFVPAFALALWSILSADPVVVFLQSNPVIPLLAGIPIGHLLWPQQRGHYA